MSLRLGSSFRRLAVGACNPRDCSELKVPPSKRVLGAPVIDLSDQLARSSLDCWRVFLLLIALYFTDERLLLGLQIGIRKDPLFVLFPQPKRAVPSWGALKIATLGEITFKRAKPPNFHLKNV